MAFCHPKTIFFKNICLAKYIYLLVYNRIYKNKFILEKPSTEGAIKKIIFSSRVSVYPHLKTLGWEPVFSKMFSEGKTRVAGSNRRVYENPSCWEQSESLLKPESLGAFGEFTKTRTAGSSRRWRCFEKQSTALAATRTINPCNHTT